MTDGGELQYSFDGGQTWKGTEIILASQTTMKFKVSDKNELMYSEDNGSTWKSSGITLANECKKALQFKVENGKVLYTLDGTKWEETGATVVDPCANPKVEFVDNEDGTVTITIGEGSIVINKPEEIVFEIKAGKVYFASNDNKTVTVKTSGIEDLTVMRAPKGWDVDINKNGQLDVTAPDMEDNDTPYDRSGYIKVHACSEDGKCMVGKILVEVSDTQIIAQAYNGKFVVGSTYESGVTVFGISTKEDYLSDAEAVIDAVAGQMAVTFAADYPYVVAERWEDTEPWIGDESIYEGEIKDVLGYEPVKGKEYVLWAFDFEAYPLDMESLVLAYYTPLDVVITEDESKKGAYDLYVNVSVTGADEYYIKVVTATDQMSVEDWKYQIVQGMKNSGYGTGSQKMEPFSGMLTDLQTDGGMQGECVPGTKNYVLVLAVDGRPNDEYAKSDIVVAELESKPLVSGGTNKVTNTERLTTKKNPYWYEGSSESPTLPLDNYTELSVKVTPSATTGWKYFYWGYIKESEYDEVKDDEAALVNYALNVANTPMGGLTEPTNADFTLSPMVSLLPSTGYYLVAFFVDNDDKYGEISATRFETTVIEKSELMVDGISNADDGILDDNAKVLEVELEDLYGTAKYYKYVWLDTMYEFPYEGMSDEDMANAIAVMEENSDSYNIVEKSNLTDNVLRIEGHEYTHSYFLAVLPYDENDKPGKAAYMLEYDCYYQIANLITDPTQFVNEPSVVFCVGIEEFDDGFENGNLGIDGEGYYRYQQQLAVLAQDGTEVKVVFGDVDNWAYAYEYDDNASDLKKAEGLWNSNIKGLVEDGYWSKYYYTANDDEPAVNILSSTLNKGNKAPNYSAMISWKSGDNHYFKQVYFTAESELLWKILEWDGYNNYSATKSPDGKQWAFTGTDFNVVNVGDSYVLDFGVLAPNALVQGRITADSEGKYVDVWNESGIPTGGLLYDMKKIDDTCGFIYIYMGEVTDEEEALDRILYYGLTDTTCGFYSVYFGGSIPSATAAATELEFVENSGVGGFESLN